MQNDSPLEDVPIYKYSYAMPTNDLTLDSSILYRICNIGRKTELEKRSFKI